MIKRTASNSLAWPGALNAGPMANLPRVFSAAAICFVVFWGSASMAAAVSQQNDTDHSKQRKDSPTITATPEHLKITGSSGSTDLAWNTGDGSTGFVFVTANGRPPVLVAVGSEGSRVISWIRTGRYVFGLYGDAERRTLLAEATVTGFAAETGSSSGTGLLSRQLRWVLIAVLIAVLYIGLYLSSAGPVPTKFPLEPTTSPRPLHVTRNLLLALVAFVCIDGVVFHTQLYTSVLAPDSYAGRMAVITRAERDRAPSGLKEVLVLGDSRMAEGFSAAVADNLSSVDGIKFVNLAEPASSVNIWDYMLREVDPTRRRYWAIVVPYGVGFEPNSADPLRISMAAPLLRYSDCFNFASAFQRWSGRFRAFTASILRGSAFQNDVVDFLAHPIERIRSVNRATKRLQSRDVYKGRDYDIVGTSFDPKTGQVTFPTRLTETQREAIRDSLVRPSQSETQDFLKIQRDGIQRILDRYSASPTQIILTPVPRGPFASLPGASMTFHAAFPAIRTQRTVFSLPEQTFDFLEKPEYYFDGYHLNAKGRQRFTETLVAELVGRLRSTDIDTHYRPDSNITAARSHWEAAGLDSRGPSADRVINRSMDKAN